MYTSLLGWQRRRYQWWALALVVLSIGLYLSQSPDAPQPRNGGTWQGYVLGTAGALLIVWLSLLGVRKRRYRSAAGTVEGTPDGAPRQSTVIDTVDVQRG